MKKEYINIPFSIPDIGDEEINAVVETLRMGWITTGPQSKKFEDEFLIVSPLITVTLEPTVLKDWGVFPADITIVGTSAETSLLK